LTFAAKAQRSSYVRISDFGSV